MPNAPKQGHIVFRGLSDMPMLAASQGTMHSNKTGTWRNIRPVIDYENCNLCMFCWKFCPDNSVHVVDGKPVIDYEYCKGCGICATECSAHTIRMEEEPS